MCPVPAADRDGVEALQTASVSKWISNFPDQVEALKFYTEPHLQPRYVCEFARQKLMLLKVKS